MKKSYIKLKILKKTLLITLSGLLGITAAAMADTVILKSGDRFQTKKAWEAQGKVKFYMQGLVVSVPIADVSQIVHAETGTARTISPPPLTTQSATPAKPKQSQRQSTPRPVVAPPSKPQPQAPDQKQTPSPMIQEHSTTIAESSWQSPGSGKDDKIDFRNLQWGMRPHEIGGIKKQGTDPAYGGVDEYYNPDDPLHIGRADLDGVVYGFWKNQLYTITMWTIGRKGYEKLRSEAFKRYGTGLQKNAETERYIWFGKTTDKLLTYDNETNAGILWMRSHKLDRQVKHLYGAR